MKSVVSIIIGSKSDYKVIEPSARFLDEHQISFELNALSSHRTPEDVKEFTSGAYKRGIKVIIAAAGMELTKEKFNFKIT